VASVIVDGWLGQRVRKSHCWAQRLTAGGKCRVWKTKMYNAEEIIVGSKSAWLRQAWHWMWGCSYDSPEGRERNMVLLAHRVSFTWACVTHLSCIRRANAEYSCRPTHAYRYYVVSMPQYVLHPFFTNGNIAFDLLQYLKHAMRIDHFYHPWP